VEVYGFSFRYPERLYYENRELYDFIPVSDKCGSIYCGNYRLRPRELVYVQWSELSVNPSWETDYRSRLLGSSASVSSERAIVHLGHDVMYANFTIVHEGQGFEGVTSAWYCETSGRVFYLQYYTVKDDAFEHWQTMVQSFVCH